MQRDDELSRSLDASQRKILAGLTSPPAIQAFLDDIPYSADPIYRCPRTVLLDRKAHCFDGALFAAAALRRLGHRPRVVDLLPEPGRDDDHMLAVFQVGGCWGAVAKSNFVGLRYREPVYRSVRELAMSYFELYYNLAREKTLRGYTVPLDLARFDGLHWTVSDGEPLAAIARRLDEIRRYSLLPARAASSLSLLDDRSYHAGLEGSDAAGLFRVKAAKR
jgi:hypothetical protein